MRGVTLGHDPGSGAAEALAFLCEILVDRVAVHGLCEVVALDEVASQPAQGVELGAGLDALGTQAISMSSQRPVRDLMILWLTGLSLRRR